MDGNSAKETRLHTISTQIRKTVLLGFLLAALYIVNTCVVRFAFVSGVSMYPTLEDGDILLVDQMNDTPSRGDVALIDISAKPLPGNYIVKRVIAVEGDTVSLDHESNTVFVNGKELSEPYLNNCGKRRTAACNGRVRGFSIKPLNLKQFLMLLKEILRIE